MIKPPDFRLPFIPPAFYTKTAPRRKADPNRVVKGDSKSENVTARDRGGRRYHAAAGRRPPGRSRDLGQPVARHPRPPAREERGVQHAKQGDEIEEVAGLAEASTSAAEGLAAIGEGQDADGNDGVGESKTRPPTPDLLPEES